jgi:hypothetical protein
MKVAFIGQPEYFRFCYEADLLALFQTREFPFHFEMGDGEFSGLISFDADVNIFFRGEYFSNEVLRQLKGVKIALSSEPFPRHLSGRLVYSKDSLLRYIDFRSKIKKKSFDYVFHYDDASLDFMAKDGLLLSGSFPFPVATSTYTRSIQDATWDLFFIGRSTNHRERFFGQLKHQYNFLHICHGIFGPPLIDYISRSKICLNVHAENEVSWEPRVQMLLACGAFVISEPITPNSILRPGVDYIEAHSETDMQMKVDYYLKNDAERERIAKSGEARVRDLLSASVCFPKLVSNAHARIYSSFSAHSGLFVLDILGFAIHIGNRVRARVKQYFG